MFFRWYNTVHRHSGIGLMTPHTVHYGHANQLTLERSTTSMGAFAANPNRFKGRAPQPPTVPTAAWINPPEKEIANSQIIIPKSLNSSRLVSQSH